MRVKGIDCEVVAKFTILRLGWEMDNEGWVASDPAGKRRLVFTSHGSAYFGEPAELDREIDTHQAALEGMLAAKSLL